MSQCKPLIRVLVALLLIFTAPPLSAREAGANPFPQGSRGTNAPEQLDKPYLILISLDGFRWDYPDLYDLPNIRRIIDQGFRAERLLPVFPTLTFPNHYSIATGLFPDHHGLVGNRFPAPELDAWYELSNRETVQDRRYYRGEPIWVTAESQGMVSAAFFFVGTEAPVRGIRPSHWRNYSKKIPGEERVDQVLEWLAAPDLQRPHLVTLYFEDVDDHSHWSGTQSEPAIAAIQRVDGYLGRLLTGLGALPHGDRVNILVVSDHGQDGYRPDSAPLVLDEIVDLEGIRVVGQGSFAFLYLPGPDPARISELQSVINQAWEHGRALTPEETPESWKLGTSNRWPHLILAPDSGYAVVKSREYFPKLNPGAHGWSPDNPAMHGVLFGQGPNLRRGLRLGAVRNVDIYPLMLGILSLDGPEDLDGDPAALSKALIKP